VLASRQRFPQNPRGVKAAGGPGDRYTPASMVSAAPPAITASGCSLVNASSSVVPAVTA
jgi:hypothetical protein